MDELSDKLKILSVEDDLELNIVEFDDSINIQKCFVSSKNFKTSFEKPGEIVEINVSNGYVICKIFPRIMFPDDTVGINKSVTNFSLINQSLEGLKLKLSDIRCVKNIETFTEVNVNIIFQTLDTLMLYDNEKELINIIKQNILKFAVVKSQSCFNLKCHKMGMARLEIKNCTPNSVGKINSKTKINILKKLTQYQYEQCNKICKEIFSLDRTMKMLTDIIHLNEKVLKNDQKNIFPPTKQVLLVGPSGCGKSSLVNLVGRKTESTIIHVFGHDVNKSNPGETESSLRDLFNTAFQYAKLAGKCIINLEDVDNLCPQNKGSAPHIQRAASQLLNLLDKAQKIPGIIVIGTSNKPEAIDPSIRRQGRLETEIYIAPPTEKERSNILFNLIKCHNFIPEDILNELCAEIATMTPGFLGADLHLLCNTLLWKYHRQLIPQDISTINCWKHEFRNVLSNMSPASLKSSMGTITTRFLSFDDLAGVDDIKKSLEVAIIWPMKHTDSFKRFGVPRPKGILLYGPPGCAKTSLVRALVSLGTFSLQSISAAELYSPYVGDAERLIRELFQRARQNTPCILFIDEIDALAGTRGEKNQINSEVQDRIIATLLTQMDGVGHRMLAADFQKETESNNDDGVIVIGATNRPDMVDAALLRPGRFDKHIYVPPPNYESRLQIFKCITKQMPLAEDVDFGYLAKATNFYSGADIKNICTEAAMIAMTENGVDVVQITNQNFRKSLSISRSSLNISQQEQYIKFNQNKCLS